MLEEAPALAGRELLDGLDREIGRAVDLDEELPDAIDAVAEAEPRGGEIDEAGGMSGHSLEDTRSKAQRERVLVRPQPVTLALPARVRFCRYIA